MGRHPDGDASCRVEECRPSQRIVLRLKAESSEPHSLSSRPTFIFMVARSECHCSLLEGV